jgi:hypothetical protein
MPKYYVRSGELEKIVIADSPMIAACDALMLCDGETIDKHFFYVDERGFRGPTPDHNVITTDLIPSHTIDGDDFFQVEGEDDDEIL